MQNSLFIYQDNGEMIIALAGSAALIFGIAINLILLLKERKINKRVMEQKRLAIRQLQTLMLLEEEIARKKIVKVAFNYLFSEN